MSVTVVQPGSGQITLKATDVRSVAFDWDRRSLRSGVAITTSTFALRAIHPSMRALSITRSGAVATLTAGVVDDSGTVVAADHGLATGDYVTVSGADQAEYNVTAQITVTAATIFTYAVSGTPATPATGAISLGGPSLTKDNASILNGANATIVCERTVGASRVTQVRLDATTALVGDEYELSNIVVTDETPAQTKTESIQVLIE